MRAFDLILAVFGLMLLSPVLLIIVVILKLSGEGEIFFWQDRVGRNGSSFKIIKFATMVKDSPNLGSGTITSKNDPRILPVGKVLRKTKLNELPQLINILRGEMSVIGPRPHARIDLEGIAADDLELMLSRRPGLSGLGSIFFRNEEAILQKFDNPRPIYDKSIAPYKAKLEIWCAQRMNLALYWKLILLTLLALIFNEHALIRKFLPGVPEPSLELRSLLISTRNIS